MRHFLIIETGIIHILTLIFIKNMDKILVMAPHADDEVLGCGGTINKLANQSKKEVYVLIVTNAHIGCPDRYSQEAINRIRQQAREAHKFLGVKQTLFFDFPAPRLDDFPSYKIAGDMNSLIQELEVDTVFIPHRGDIHKDHRIVYESALVACRPTGNCPVKEIYAYETLSETEWSSPFADDAFHPNVFISLSQQNMDAKIKAFTYFKSQVKQFPESRSTEALEALAKLRGSTITKPFAEAFMLVRKIYE